jgi:iron complex transport system substrate-binding protein
VKIRRGRATVTGDNRFNDPLGNREGEAEGRPGSQETAESRVKERQLVRISSGSLYAQLNYRRIQMKSKTLSLLAILLTVLVLPAAAGEGTFPLTMTDDGGTEITIREQPDRIASVTLFTDDVLFELVPTDRIIAVTAFAEDEAISNIPELAAKIPNKITLNVEVILSLKPDLVFVANWSDADKIEQLRNAGINVFLIASGLTIEEIQDKIMTVAKAVGETGAGKNLLARMDRRLTAVADKVSGIPEGNRPDVIDYTVWSAAQGNGTSWDEIVIKAGLKNGVGHLPVNDWGQVPLSKEKLIELDPDILVLPGWVYGDPEGADAFYNQTIKDPALKILSAVRNKRIFMMPERLKTTTSHYIVDAVEWLAEKAYPEKF